MTVYQRVVIIAAVCLCIGGIMMLLDVPFMTKGMKQKYTDESVKSYYKKARRLDRCFYRCKYNIGMFDYEI